MHTTDLGEALLAVAEAHERHLGGAPFRLSRTAEPLVTAIGDATGLGPLTMVRANQLLAGALATFGQHHRSRAGEAEPATVAKVVGFLWGVTAHPCSVPQALALAKAQASERASYDWPRLVSGDPHVLRWVQTQVTRTTVPDAFEPWLGWAAPGPGGEKIPPDQWPPISPVSGRPGSSERELLVEQVLAALRRPDPAKPDSFRPPEEYANAACRDVRTLALLALRDATDVKVHEWYHRGREPGDQYLRHFRHTVLAGWYDDYLLDPSVPHFPGLLPVTDRKKNVRDAVAAAVGLLMYQAARDHTLLHRTARDRADRPVQITTLMTQARPGSFRIFPDSDLPLSARHTAFDILGTSKPLTLATGSLAPPSDASEPAGLLQLSYVIRQEAAEDPLAARKLILEYLKVRPAALDRAHGSVHDHRRIALADHGVQWDCVVLGERALMRQLGSEIRQRPARVHVAYQSHTWRANAVTLNKATRWGAAIGQVWDGLAVLAALNEHGQVTVPELAASQHQLLLAGAGIMVRRLEWGLARPSGDVLKAVSGALRMSALAREALRILDDGSLPTARHVDGQIACTAWRVQTNVIRLRALLAAHTAIEAGIAPVEAVLADYRDSAPDAQLALFGTEEDSVEECLDIATIRQAYGRVLQLPDLGPGHRMTLIPLAAWLAFINGGRIPVGSRPSFAFISGIEPLVDPDGQDVAGAAPFSIEQLVTWLAGQPGPDPVRGTPYGRGTVATERAVLRGADIGILSWLPNRGKAWNALNRLSGGTYAEFRKRHEPYKPIDMSHD